MKEANVTDGLRKMCEGLLLFRERFGQDKGTRARSHRRSTERDVNLFN